MRGGGKEIARAAIGRVETFGTAGRLAAVEIRYRIVAAERDAMVVGVDLRGRALDPRLRAIIASLRPVVTAPGSTEFTRTPSINP